MKSVRARITAAAPLLVAAFFLLVLTITTSADTRERNPVESLTQEEIDALAKMYGEKGAKGLYESDPAFRDAVLLRASQQTAQRVRQAREEVRRIEDQQIQDAFLRSMKEFRDIYGRATKDKEWYHAAGDYGGASTAHWNDQVARTEAAVANGDAAASQSTVDYYKRLASGSDALHRMAKIARDYDELSKKSAAADAGGAAEMADFSASAMKAFLAHAKDYVDVLAARQSGELAKLAPLGQSIPGIRGPNSEQIIERVLATEGNIRALKDAGWYASEAIKKIDTASKVVRTLDQMINNPDFARLEDSEYLTQPQKEFGTTMIAAGKAVQGLADIFGADIGNVPAQILKDGGLGIEAIGQAVGFAGELEKGKRQRGTGGIATEYSGPLDNFGAVNLTVRQNGATSVLTIPDGSGGYVTLSGDDLKALSDAVSAFTSLAGRNPTQKELATLAAGGDLIIDGRRVNMNSLSNPHTRTDNDLRGAERTELDAFIKDALAGLPEGQKKGLDPDSGVEGGWSRQDHRDKRDEMDRLTQELYGVNVSSTLYGADLLQHGRITENLEEVIKANRTTLERLEEMLEDESLSQRERLEAEKRYIEELRRLQALAAAREKAEKEKAGGTGEEEGETAAGDTGKKDEESAGSGGSVDDALRELTGGATEPDPEKARTTAELLEDTGITRTHHELREAFDVFDESALDLAQQIRNISASGEEICHDETVGYLFYTTAMLNEIVQSLYKELLVEGRRASGMNAGGRNLSEPDMDMLNSRDQLRISAGTVMAGRAEGTYELLTSEIERLDAGCDLDDLLRSGEEVAELDQDPESGVDGGRPPVTGSGDDTGDDDDDGDPGNDTDGDFVAIGSVVEQNQAGQACDLGTTASVTAQVSFPERVRPNSTFTIQVNATWNTAGKFDSAELLVFISALGIEKTETSPGSSGSRTFNIQFNSSEVDFSLPGHVILVTVLSTFECDDRTGDSGFSNQVGRTQAYSNF